MRNRESNQVQFSNWNKKLFQSVRKTHTDSFYKLIEDFHNSAMHYEFTKVNNQLLNLFLSDLNRKRGIELEGLEPVNMIKDLVYLITVQNQFIVELEEQWKLYKKFNAIHINHDEN